jgi:hypothetical protein
VTLPPSVSAALLRFGAPAETIAWADDLYRHLGPPVVDALRELVESQDIPVPELRPEHLDAIRPMLGERYLRQHHAAWARGGSSPAFWCDRSQPGAARGIVTALGDVATQASPLLALLAQAVRRVAGDDQPPPRGTLLVSQNAHRGNQEGTLAFDLVPSELSDALALNAAQGRHHTLPGSIGQTSGRVLTDPPLAIVWEIQPNVFKPAGARNREAAKAYRRHRAWPLVTTAAAFLWLRERGYRVYVLRGDALRAAHEVNPSEPLSAEIERLHDLTVARAADGLGLYLGDVARRDAPPALASLAKVNLGKAIEERGLFALVRELRP